MTRNRWIALGLATLVSLILAACSGGGGSSPAPTVEPTPGLAANPNVVGHNTCQLLDGASNPSDPEGHLRCVQVASDARLSGTLEVTFRYADIPGSSTMVMWGPSTLTNDGGTWACNMVGLRSPAVLHALDIACRGSGGYDGLSYYLQQLGDADYSAFSGWIENRP